MQPITAPVTAPGRTRPRGRWIWPLTGTATVLLLGTAISVATIKAGTDHFGQFNQSALPARTVLVSGTVTSMNVTSYGAPIRVSRGPVSQVTVVETIGFNPPDHPPAVRASVHDGALTLAAPSCQDRPCSVGFTVTVPATFPDVTVTAQSNGGPVTVSGVAAADIDSSSGPVSASDVRGLLTVTSDSGDISVTGAGSASLASGSGSVSASGIPGMLNITSSGGRIDVHGTGSATLDSGSGPVTASGVLGTLAVSSAGGSINITAARGAVNLDSGSGDVVARSVDGALGATTSGGKLQVDGLTGPLTADTGSGPLTVSGLTSATARVTTEGGSAWLSFAAAPQSVQVITATGDAVLVLPGGPYAVSAQSNGGPDLVSVPVSPTAADTISVNTGGGELQVKPPAAS